MNRATKAIDEASMRKVFERIISVEMPKEIVVSAATGQNESFRLAMQADGDIPFPQFIVRRDGVELLVVRAQAARERESLFIAEIPANLFGSGTIQIQAEGCRRPDIEHARADDWIKWFHTIRVSAPARQVPPVAPKCVVSGGLSHEIRVYFGIHKHMHQPYYRTADAGFWDGTTDQIFGSRRGPYVDYLVDAVERYTAGALPHAGLSTSYSGSLVEQLDRCDREKLAGGGFANWRERLKNATSMRTELGHPRIDFAAFGFFHPLMPLIPARDIVRQIEWHRRLIADKFNTSASTVLFPPETAFHVRMIPALVKAGIQAVIYDSIHRFRACKDYPYAGKEEGMLPPNRADQQNPAVHDWLQLQNIWAGSRISPSLLRPTNIRYVDADDSVHHIIGVPAERYIGNEDARGGFGALQYPDVLAQVYNRIAETGSYAPKHPPFFVLHSDGDNHGGGADSYYRHNTERLVEWLKQDRRFELTTIHDYLERFPVDPRETIHVEPGSWSGADNGDPQFMKWFSRWDQAYSPDLNSWAVLTALQNLIHSAEDCIRDSPGIEECQRLLLMAETSCYWYWTGQEIWDSQVTNAANRATSLLSGSLDAIQRADQWGPTIFPAWISPPNPGGKSWGPGCLVDAPRQATLHTLIDDVSGIRSAVVVIRSEKGERRLPLVDLGLYPCRTGASRSAHHFSVELPIDLGPVRYFVEAVDGRGNLSRGSVDHVYLP
jgi:hypothetical protein